MLPCSGGTTATTTSAPVGAPIQGTMSVECCRSRAVLPGPVFICGHWRRLGSGEKPLRQRCLGLAVFFDAGSAWFAGDLSDPFDRAADLIDVSAEGEPHLRRSFGFGVGTSDDGFRVNLARPLDGNGDQWRLSARISRPF